MQYQELEDIIIMHKSSGLPIYHKSFSELERDPNYISSFIASVQSFGKFMETESSLEEMSLGDKSVLIGNGNYSIVVFILGDRISFNIQQILNEIVNNFDQKYFDKLSNWNGNLDEFDDIEDFINQFLVNK